MIVQEILFNSTNKAFLTEEGKLQNENKVYHIFFLHMHINLFIAELKKNNLY